MHSDSLITSLAADATNPKDPDHVMLDAFFPDKFTHLFLVHIHPPRVLILYF